MSNGYAVAHPPRSMRKLKKDAPPEITGHHGKSMLYLFLAIAISVGSFIIPTQVFGMELSFVMGIPMFSIPFTFLFIMLCRSENAVCPECSKKMKKKRKIEVVEDIEAFGRYQCSPYNVFFCDSCGKDWRVPAIAIGEGGSISRKQYKEMIEPDVVGNG